MDYQVGPSLNLTVNSDGTAGVDASAIRPDTTLICIDVVFYLLTMLPSLRQLQMVRT